MTNAPIRFDPALERPTEDEPETHSKLEDTFRIIRETTFEHLGHAVRSVHAKSHGILHATLTVPPDLPPHMAQGLFAQPGRYEAVLRLSTIPGDILPDAVSVPRGAALKVLGVQGERLPGSEADTTQDFVMASGPAFSAPTARKFLGNLKLLAATTDRAEGAKKLLSRVARMIEAVIEAFGAKSPLINTLGGHPPTHILGEPFYSQTPYRFGDYVAKFSLAPLSPSLTAHAGEKVAITATPNALRDAVTEHFATQGGEWELRAQLLTDPERMPIEDASVVWPEDASPYVPIARLVAEPQPAWETQREHEVDHCMSFSPWNGLEAHRPLGGINRARHETYASSAAFRGEKYGCPMHQPRELAAE